MGPPQFRLARLLSAPVRARGRASGGHWTSSSSFRIPNSPLQLQHRGNGSHSNLPALPFSPKCPSALPALSHISSPRESPQAQPPKSAIPAPAAPLGQSTDRHDFLATWWRTRQNRLSGRTFLRTFLSKGLEELTPLPETLATSLGSCHECVPPNAANGSSNQTPGVTFPGVAITHGPLSSGATLPDFSPTSGSSNVFRPPFLAAPGTFSMRGSESEGMHTIKVSVPVTGTLGWKSFATEAHPVPPADPNAASGAATKPDSEPGSKAGPETEKGGTLLGTLGRTKEGEKPRVVVLGTGWAAARFLKDLDTKIYDVVCISPRNHMVFTPLLTSTCVGTLEFRSVAEPIRNIQPALSQSPGSYYFLGRCTSVDPANHEVTCEVSEGFPGRPDLGTTFKVAYDKLVLAPGAQATTFNIPGVHENAVFLREVTDAQAIRRRLLTNLMTSDTPGLPLEEKERLVHCVVVGGGPTGVEFSGELSDFIHRDVRNKYTHVKDLVRVTLIEANEILSSFDVRLRQYATRHLQKSGVRLVKGMVKAVYPEHLELTDGTQLKYGVLVWSTGVGPSDFVKSLPFEKSPGGRIGVDEYLRVPGSGSGPVEDIFAIGDCAGYLTATGKPVLPALAQVAERQGRYLARLVNKIGANGGGGRGASKAAFEQALLDPFVYRHLGSMAAVGRYKALVDLRETKEAKGISLAGFLSWLIWRSAYLTRVVSWRNRFYVAINWATTFVFGRDISRL